LRFHQFFGPTLGLLAALAVALSSLLKSRTSLQLENLALRQRITVLQRSAKKRPKLTAVDRFFRACLGRVWATGDPRSSSSSPRR
jgi:regulator of replication initiation timing